jgi:DNA-binding NarL/FixJ family response regulator
VKKVRLIVVDDQKVVRAGLCRMLETDPGITVVGEASDGREALSVASAVHPDIVLMDVAMPGMDGIAATAELSRTAPEIAVVMLTLHDDADTRARAMAAGATAFVPKQQLGAGLLAAVRQAAAPWGEG